MHLEWTAALPSRHSQKNTRSRFALFPPAGACGAMRRGGGVFSSPAWPGRCKGEDGGGGWRLLSLPAPKKKRRPRRRGGGILCQRHNNTHRGVTTPPRRSRHPAATSVSRNCAASGGAATTPPEVAALHDRSAAGHDHYHGPDRRSNARSVTLRRAACACVMMTT